MISISGPASPLPRVWVFLVCLVLSFLRAGATTYYVDSEHGDDTNTGTEELLGWKSLDKASSVKLAAGDKLLFSRGGSWSGQLSIKDSGSDGNPIYVGAFGDETKPKPVINGEGKVQAAIYIKNSANYITVENMAVTNFDGKDIFDGAEAVRCGIQAGMWDGTLTQIKLLHNEIYFVESASNHPTVGPPRGSTLDPKNAHQYACAALFANGTQLNGLLIDGNSVHDCTGTGILAFAFKKVTGLLIQNNQVNNVGSDGIEILNATSPVVQYNSCIHAGNNSGKNPRAPGELGANGLSVCGMWATGSSDVLFQYNYCEGTRQIKYDGEAWDFDNGLTGTCIYQFNFSRDNEGGFILTTYSSAAKAKAAGLTTIARFNISVNDGHKQGAGEGFFNDYCDLYYNNIFYRDDGHGFMPPDNKLSAPMSGTFENNIFYTNAKTDISYQTATRIFSHNCFYGHTPIEAGANAVIEDPQFADSATAIAAHSLKDLAGFQLNLGSPCVGTGRIIPDNGGKDFWGNAIPSSRMDIGAQSR